MRPNDGDALRSRLRDLRGATGLPVVFGGVADAQMLVLTQQLGTRTKGLLNLRVEPSCGLGGRAFVEQKPGTVDDYASARSITHDYDGPVVGEGLRALVAAPVVVNGRTRAMVYGAIRERVRLGQRVVDVVRDAARGLARELDIRDEVDRRVRMLQAVRAEPAGLPARDVEELREAHAELCSIAEAVDDVALRKRVRAVGDSIARLGDTTSDVSVVLTERERDVLAQIACGCTNAEAADRLAIGAETVKAYLRSAMRKLDAHNRHEAVVAARRAGVLL
ncbi:MAG TPA: LuxR C-terminal-related transcriptional regulator [Nocardioidaceae bacterium]|nr:LuxR C-terminal-related transcriptional regulator [Nocardioidaceae bacterium]